MSGGGNESGKTIPGGVRRTVGKQVSEGGRILAGKHRPPADVHGLSRIDLECDLYKQLDGADDQGVPQAVETHEQHSHDTSGKEDCLSEVSVDQSALVGPSTSRI